jgi:hypothetical protein
MNLTELNEQRKILRKLPGHCGSCGKPHVGEYRLCDKCRARTARHKQKVEAFAALQRRLVLLEMKVERQANDIKRLQKKHDTARKVAYINGARAAKKKFDAPTPEMLPTISIQEAAQLSHEFNER